MNLDEDRILQAAEGNTEAFGQLYDRHCKALFNFILRLVGNYQTAEDILQQTMLQAYRNASSYRGDSQVATWLYKIAKNLCLDQLRKKESTSRDEIELFAEGTKEIENALQQSRSIETPETGLAEKELELMVQRAISLLPDDQRLVLILRETQNHSYQEIAEIAGCSISAVKMRILRARQAFKEIIAPYLRDGSLPTKLHKRRVKNDEL